MSETRGERKGPEHLYLPSGTGTSQLVERSRRAGVRPSWDCWVPGAF